MGFRHWMIRAARTAAVAAGIGLVVMAASLLVLLFRPSTDGYDHLEPATEGGLVVHYFGTSSLALVTRGEALVVDGFLTRPGLVELLWPLRPDEARIRSVIDGAGVRKISAVMVGHGHFDHAMDAATLARLYGGEVWGGPSVSAIATAEGFAHTRVLVPGMAVEAGQAVVTPFALDHSPAGKMMGLPDPGFTIPARVRDYRYGEGLGFHIRIGDCRVLVVPSAGLPEQSLKGLSADVVFLAIGRLGVQDDAYIRRYWDSTVGASRSRWVVVTHWDDFTRPLDRPMVPLPYALDRMDKAMTALTALAGNEVRVVLPVAGHPLDIPPLRHCSG